MTTNPSQQEQAARRLHMVNGQLRTTDVDDMTLLAAFLEVPRERFVPPAFAKLAYLDQDQLALGAAERRVLAPRTLARLLQAANDRAGRARARCRRRLRLQRGPPRRSGRLGRPARIRRRRAGRRETALAGTASIDFVEGDLAAGAPGKGPFDVIVLNGAFETTPRPCWTSLRRAGGWSDSTLARPPCGAS